MTVRYASIDVCQVCPSGRELSDSDRKHASIKDISRLRSVDIRCGTKATDESRADRNITDIFYFLTLAFQSHHTMNRVHNVQNSA